MTSLDIRRNRQCLGRIPAQDRRTAARIGGFFPLARFLNDHSQPAPGSAGTIRGKTMKSVTHGRTGEAEMPTDLLAGLLMEMTRETRPAIRPGRVPLKVYGVMAVTTLLTFATLTAGYQLLFVHPVFA
jgi:hypothetical protein